MKRIYLIPAAVLLILLTVVCWDSIMDFLPIDQSGWVTTEQGIGYLDENGDPVSGWFTVEETEYYFHPDTLALYTGWADRSGIPCYVKDGIPLTGWTDTPEGRFFLRQDGSIHTGWLEYGGKRIYLDEKGLPANGWTETPEGRFYLAADGSLCTGITETADGTYCFDAHGKLCSGWFRQNGKHYFADKDGRLHTGWLEHEGNTYYLQQDGSAAVGKVTIEGKAHFFSSTGMEFIFVNPWNALPEDFTVELEVIEGASADPVCKEDLVQMLSDCRAAGMTPQILSGYRSVADQTFNFQVSVWNYVAQGFAYTTAYDKVRMSIAVPGTSEHHLGLAFDIVDTRFPFLEETQANTETQQWLMEHSWEYGFILRYPEGSTKITGIVYEPWHYRYVGREMAAEIYRLGITLEEYVDKLTNDGTTCSGTDENRLS